MATWRRVLIGATAACLAGCARVVAGIAGLPPTENPGSMLPAGVEINRIMLDQERMRGITGTDERLTIIPTMDAGYPVDIDPLADTVPPQCRFAYAETAIFGTEFTQFHKTTFQYPPKGALISEGAAAYPDADTARRAFETLVSTISECSDTTAGEMLVGDWVADAEALHIRAGRCGHDYLLKSVVLLEVTFCGFGESVSQIVMTNLAAGVPG